MTVKIGKHGANAGVSVLADTLVGYTYDSFSNSNGSFRGEQGKATSTGQLPAEWAALYHSSVVTYTVFSYNTPIAWAVGYAAWVVPPVSYSATTSGHQGKLKAALAYNNRNYRTEI